MDLPIPESIKPWLNFVHPIFMWGLLLLSIYTAVLGFQIRQMRKTDDTDKKKELAKKKVNVRHFQISSALLSLMILGSLGGMAVTYINNGKLFFGPHLLVGLGMTGLIATSAALSPFMQKGQEWARNTHIALNVSLVGLFGWQAFTGMEIVQRILTKMFAE
ncbi:MAG: DUF4079 domain-containing protein [Elainellaceae cyanobacterium]